MKKLKKKALPFLISVGTSASVGIIYAEDIEIYLGSNDTNSSVNVMFMLDTSGSMGSEISGSNDTRMHQAKEGLKEVINSLPGDMRVGLGRFNDPGGSVLFPARALDDELLTDIIKRVSYKEDDAFERTKTDEVFVYTDTLDFEPNVRTESIKVRDEYDDAEECPSGNDLYIINQTAGISYDSSGCQELNSFIFRDFDIPQGASISSAQMTLFTPGNYNYYSVKADVHIEKDTNPRSFSSYSGRRVHDREYYSTTKEWQFSPTSYYTQNYSPELKDLIQILVNRSDWDESDNGFNLMLKSKSPWYRNTYATAYNGSNYSPVLTVSYKDTGSQNLVGVRFREVNAPSGSIVHKGLLKLIASSNNGTGKLKISTESGKNPASFKEENKHITNRSLDPVYIEVDYTDWNSGEERLFDVSKLIQNKFNTSDWCGGGDIAFIIESDSADAVYSYDYEAELAPELIMQYNGGTDSSCKTYDVITQINDFGDDSYQKENQKNYPYKSSVYIEDNGYGGFIFRTQDVPPSAKIKSAKFHFVSKSGNDTSENYKFNLYVRKPSSYPIDEYDNDKKDISNRISTTLGGDSWTVGTDAYENTTFISPDISSYIESVVNSSAYVNADKEDRGFEIILRSTNGDFKAFSFDSNPGKSGKLVIEYEGTDSDNISSLSSKTINVYSDTSSNITVRQYLMDLIDDQPSNGWTPMEGALYEAGKYFEGGAVNYGRSRNVSQTPTSVIKTDRISQPETYTGGTHYYPNGCSQDYLSDTDCIDEYIQGSPTYISPMTDNVCESNNIIMITDGYPNSQINYRSTYKDYNNIPLAVLIQDETGVYCDDNWSCAFAWVQHMFDNDYQEDKVGKNNVFTHVIGFDKLDSEGKLRELANKGGGIFVPANNTNELVKALNLIIASIMEVESTLATPGVAVNQNNRTQHLSDVYYSVFQPSVAKSWFGNLKKYNIDEIGETITDKFSNDAVDPSTGFFAEGTTSFWSNEEDGGVVERGGASSHFDYPQNTFTYTGSDSPKNVKLNQNKHKLDDNNDDLTMDLFGLSNSDISNGDFDKFREWLGGKDILDEDLDGQYDDARKLMGDPLHSRPVLVNYNENKDVVFVSTNEGFLHATDAETGENYFSFMPQELLPNAYEIFIGGSGNHVYGLDSSWIAWRHDSNKDGEIVKSDGDKIIIYSGMRRGGDNFYALDVTDTSDPRLLFVKKPDDGGMFEDMGQTWSEPVLGRFRINGTDRVGLLFGGGYDLAYDNVNYNGLYDSLGNQLFMLDADTGEIIWTASGTLSQANLKISGMEYSITSRPTLVDLTGDGYVDILYLTDLSGQILKIKFDKDNTGVSNLASGKVIAKFGKSTGNLDKSDTRLMYDSIVVAPIKDGNEKYMAIVGGTGYRAYPLNKDKQDIIFMFKDKEDLYDTQEIISSPIDLGDLADLTNELNEDDINEALDGKKGYYITLVESSGDFIGEKVTGEPLIYDNQIIINTYIPDEERTECMPVIGYSRGYRMNIFDGTPTKDRNDDGTITKEDRYEDKLTSGIANGSKIIYTENGVLLLTNTKVEKIGSGGDMGMSKRRWYREID